MTIKEAVYLVRPYSLPASISPVLVAITAFLTDGNYISIRTLLGGIGCFFVALFGQCFSNIVNDLADFETGADSVDRKGFDRIIASGIVEKKAAKQVAFVFALLTVIIGLLVILLVGNFWLLLLGLIVLWAAYSYTAGPFPLSYHALGEVAVFIFYGLVATIGPYYVATGMITWSICLLACAMGFASVNILLVNNYRDVASDAKVGKNTIAVRFGAELLPILYTTNILLVILCIIPYYNAVTILLIVPYFLFAMRLSRQMKTHTGAALNRTLSKTALSVLLLAMTLIVILLVYKFM